MSDNNQTPAVPVRIAQFMLLGPLGALVVFGSIYFSAIAPPQHLVAHDWVVAAWALAMGLTSLYLGTCLGRGEERFRRAAIGLAALHIAFSLVKLIAYHESEATTFMAFDLLVIALLGLPRSRRSFRVDAAGLPVGS